MSDAVEREVEAARSRSQGEPARTRTRLTDFALGVAQVLAVLGAVGAIVGGLVFLFRGEFLLALVAAPLSFLTNVALATVFGYVRRMR